MAQPVTIGTQPFLLDFVVIPLKKKGYDAILGRGWLVTTKVNHNWKKNTLSMEKGGQKYIIDLRTQVIDEELASSDSDSEDSNSWEWDSYEGKDKMEPNDEGVLELDGCSEDDICSLNGLFHWQMEDYEVFHPVCHMLQIEEEPREKDEFPSEYREYKEGEAKVNDALAYEFSKDKPMQYEYPTVKEKNLGDTGTPRNI